MFPHKHTLLSDIGRLLLRAASVVIFVISVATPLGLIYMFGFPQDATTEQYIDATYNAMLILMWIALTVRVLLITRPSNKRGHWITVMAYGILTAIAIFNTALHFGWLVKDRFLEFTSAPAVAIAVLLIISVLELSNNITHLLSRRLNPSMILAGSFLAIIVFGSGLLMLPNSTYSGISYIDALFTSASAVCVTGLNVVGTSETFTLTGQVLILMLIQIGGLGIMTITSFFSLFFMGQNSLKSQLLISDLLSSDTIAGLGRTLLKIIFITLFVEGVGAILLYSAVVGENGFEVGGQTIFFAIFHSVSAFCNAGYSTLSGNIYDPVVRNIAAVPTIISWLIIFGGLGFPIFANILSIATHSMQNLFRRIVKMPTLRRPRLWSLNSYIVLRTTILLLAVSYGLMLTLEWNHSLAEYGAWDKLSQGLLMAVTPRTAGFNGVNLSSMLPVTVVVTIVLMWIGGAPQSTAGGIKVTTFYVAIKSAISVVRNSGSVEAYNRELPPESTRRASAVVILSLIVISMSVMLLSVLEPDMELLDLTFEVVSALSTVGLSLGITPELGEASKLIIITLMYVGRVGLIGIAMSLVRAKDHQPYSLPTENVLIN